MQNEIIIPNGETGQQFQISVKNVSINISVQSDERLVTNPGKKTEKVLPLNPYANMNIAINLPLTTPEELEKALAENPMLTPILARIEQEMQARFKV
jgi:hypothetical protein